MHNVGENCGSELHAEDDEQQNGELQMIEKLRIELENSKWITYDVHQHGAFLQSADASGDSDKHQTDWDNHHEGRRREEMIIDKNAEVIENGVDCGAHSHQQQRSQLQRE